MTGTGGVLGAWGSLVLLGLCSWSGAGASAPNPVTGLRVENQTTSSISLRWEAPATHPALNYTYGVRWARQGAPNETRQTTADTSFRAEGLDPGSLYEFSVWAEEGGLRSDPRSLGAATAPNPVRNLSVENQTASSIGLRWEAPEGPEPNYTYGIQWPGHSDRNETRNTNKTWYIVEGLSAVSSYEFSVWAERNGVSSSRVTLQASTAPNPVTSLRVENQTTSSISLRWEAPAGPALNYTYGVRWARQGAPNVAQQTADTSFTAEGLDPGSLYEFSVWAEEGGLRSDPRSLGAATAPNEVTALKKESQTNTSITLRWEAPREPHPQLYMYGIQWAGGEHPQKEQKPPGYRANQTARTNETWYVVNTLEPGTLYSFRVWAERNDVASSAQNLLASTDPDPVSITSCISISGGYGVLLTWSCPLGGYEAFELQVSGAQSSQDRASCERSVYVSGLQPARAYPVTVTTIWAGMRAPPASGTCYTQSSVVIIGAIIGALLFLILGGLLIFFLKKRYGKNREESAAPSFSRDILVRDFADHVRKNEKDSHCGFTEEFQHLCRESHSLSQTVASAPENCAKNRYRNVLPYDWSCVPLKPLPEEPGSGYINASFVPGLWSPREFIAAQGPLPQTVGDFWRMVWEQHSHTLVMLTNCVESGWVKCEIYWPLDTTPCTHRHLQVTLQGEHVTENWAVRDLKLWHMQEQKAMFVRQFHFMAWPDHGVPHSPDPLLAFWKVLRQWLDRNPGGGPPIVHCSAGVGRTGTLIALDVLLRQLEREGVVGPFSYVKKMRESRPLMVQTEAQYMFLHQCIARFLEQSSQMPAKRRNVREDLIFENEAAAKGH